MSDVEALWADRLAEATARIGPGIDPAVLADRYDVDDRDAIATLSNEALQEAFDSGWGELRLEHFDRAADRLGVAT